MVGRERDVLLFYLIIFVCCFSLDNVGNWPLLDHGTVGLSGLSLSNFYNQNKLFVYEEIEKQLNFLFNPLIQKVLEDLFLRRC